MSDRGVSSPIGVILLIGMTVAVVTTVVVVGGAAIDDTRANAERSQMENAMSQFSSKASLVSLGESGSQQFNLGRASEGDVSVHENTGNVSLYVNRTDGPHEYIANVSMGSIVYRNDDTQIAYQGGGVWKRTNGHSTMVSPPEYHYKFETLTYPIINVSGIGSTSGQISGTVHTSATTRQLFPNEAENPDFTNPLDNGTVYVQIESDYCGGWQSFFRSRSQGELVETCDAGDEDVVLMDLTVGLDPAFGAAVTSENIENDGADVDSSRAGIVAPSASGLVDEKISNCGDTNCKDFAAGDSLSGGNTYYTNNSEDFNSLDINTSSGDVNIVIDDEDSGIDKTKNIDVYGDNNVTVYVKTKEDISLAGGNNVINSGNNPSQFIMYVHSQVSAIKMNSASYTGGIYAPNTALEGDQGNGNGNGNGGGGGCGGGSTAIKGSVIVENFCFRNGNFDYVESMGSLEVEVDLDTITYLHVSESRVEVDLT